ncbi:ATP-dependent RNA helicase dbp6, partial [Pseudocercospora fuligena]
QEQPRKRRHKLESVLAAAQAASGAGEDEKAPNDMGEAGVGKHSGILGKFLKSVKRTEEDEDKEAQAGGKAGPVPTVVSQLSLPEPDIDRTHVEHSAASVLPSWLSQPTVVSAERRATFSELGLESSTVKRMAGLGFQDALPVQQALIPLLLPPGEAGSSYLPGCEERMPDIAVSAPTGSGKTISYLLPIIQALRKKGSDRGRLRALIIVPTRELALQVDAVAKALSSGSDIKTEHIPGNRTHKEEQQKLINRSRSYNPEECQRRLGVAKLRIDGLDQSSGDARDDTRIDETVADTIAGFANHIPTYDSAVDLLVATPGRLMEHISNTSGFTLTHVQWLVIDEADKLLDNQQEKVLSDLDTELMRPRFDDEQDARERYLRASDLWDERRERLLRKVVLSATMTRDISKLSSLRLRRPKLVVVRGTEVEEEVVTPSARNAEGGETGSVRQSAEGFELPTTLSEYSVPVGDGSEKPLVVVELLRSRVLNGLEASAQTPTSTEKSLAPTVLIFTSSNESAHRLAHLLKALKPAWSKYITTLVKSSRPNVRSKMNEPAIVVSTDRASRGLDSIKGRPITHVVQYDIPRSLIAYIHRVGRTARAGRLGTAWTLFAHREGKWFTQEITQAANVKRAQLVERVKIFNEDQDLKARYEEVLGEMREEVQSGK